MGVVTVDELKPSVAGARPFRPLSSAGQVIEWPISDVSSDLTIEVGNASFDLHKFPLVSRSGKIRKLLTNDNKPARLNLSTVPGGPHVFEQAAKFCYGFSIELTASNVAGLRCVAHFLEMTEEFSDKNLELITEAYLRDSVLPCTLDSITSLHQCENLLPIAEEINLVSRLINAIASNACTEQLSSRLSELEFSFGSKPGPEPEMQPEWWGKLLASLDLDFFRRVLSAVKAKGGLKQEIISRILIHYTQRQNSLRGFVAQGSPLLVPDTGKKQRSTVETVVGLLPTQSRNSVVPIAFLSNLLKSAMLSSASISARSDLERRIGIQLDRAILEDILIPADSHGNSDSAPLYDTDVVMRIFSTFLNLDGDDDMYGGGCCRDESEMVYDIDTLGSPKQTSLAKASKLLDNYLAEVSLDLNLVPSKMIALAELLPEHARVVYDGLYRAVDIFLKVHPTMKDSDRYRLCKAIDCQKLSQEACSHAAQNERLPVQMAVQVLYFEQIRLRNAMNGVAALPSGGAHDPFSISGGGSHFPYRFGNGAGSGCISPRDNYASVRRENRELKIEVARMRMRLTDLEKDHVTMKQELVRAHGPENGLLELLRRTLSKLNALFRARVVKGGSQRWFLFQKRRHHNHS